MEPKGVEPKGLEEAAVSAAKGVLDVEDAGKGAAGVPVEENGVEEEGVA